VAGKADVSVTALCFLAARSQALSSTASLHFNNFMKRARWICEAQQCLAQYAPAVLCSERGCASPLLSGERCLCCYQINHPRKS